MSLSHRRSHKRRRPTEQSSTLFLNATPILSGEKAISDSMTRWLTSVVRALRPPCWPFAVTPQWRLAVVRRRGLGVVRNPLCGYVLAAICESCLVDELLPSIFRDQTRSCEGTLYDVTKGADASPTLQCQQNLKTKIIDW